MASSEPITISPPALEMPGQGGQQPLEIVVTNNTDNYLYDVTIGLVMPEDGDYGATITGFDPSPGPVLTPTGVQLAPNYGFELPQPLQSGETAWVFFVRHVAPQTTHALRVTFVTARAGTGTEATLGLLGFNETPSELEERPSPASPGEIEWALDVHAHGRTYKIAFLPP